MTNTPKSKGKKEKRVLCYFCKKPIHIDELAGVFKAKDNKEAWFHDNIVYLTQFNDYKSSCQNTSFVEKIVKKFIKKCGVYEYDKKTGWLITGKMIIDKDAISFLKSALKEQKEEMRKKVISFSKSIKTNQ